ncbi:MAG TPA: phytanoyl-CoA dioxygenase family protein [Trebonia sp.]|nr:phytanoyl-CoA dioxygenase family protein [Trebonia sp.]
MPKMMGEPRARARAGQHAALPYDGIRITSRQRADFDRDGYLIIRDAIEPGLLERLIVAQDRVYAQQKARGLLHHQDQSMHLMGFLHRDRAFLELLELPSVFPLVWGILGWNIHAYHHHIDVHPPVPPGTRKTWRWHQDGGRQNLEIETEPIRPLLSIRTAFYLSDLSQPGRGNFMCVPGSHRTSRLARPQDLSADFEQPQGAIEVCASPGDVVLFDRRLYHGRSDNYSDIVRRCLFIGWTFRWIAPHEDRVITPEHPWWAELTPIQRQLLGGGKDALSYWGIGDSYPLREYLRERDLLDPEVKNNR